MVSTFRGDLARWKRKMKGPNFPSDFARGKRRESLHFTGDFVRGKERIKDLDFPGEFVRGRENIES